MQLNIGTVILKTGKSTEYWPHKHNSFYTVPVKKKEFFSSHKLLHLRVEITHVASLFFPSLDDSPILFSSNPN